MDKQEFVYEAKRWIRKMWLNDLPIGKLERVLGALTCFDAPEYDGRDIDLDRLCNELDSFDLNEVCAILNKHNDWKFNKCLV